jgi:hypothetical protein
MTTDERKQAAAIRQRRFRERKRKQSITEVRGIWAAPELHERIRKYAKRLTSR